MPNLSTDFSTDSLNKADATVIAKAEEKVADTKAKADGEKKVVDAKAKADSVATAKAEKEDEGEKKAAEAIAQAEAKAEKKATEVAEKKIVKRSDSSSEPHQSSSLAASTLSRKL